MNIISDGGNTFSIEAHLESIGLDRARQIELSCLPSLAVQIEWTYNAARDGSSFQDLFGFVFAAWSLESAAKMTMGANVFHNAHKHWQEARLVHTQTQLTNPPRPLAPGNPANTRRVFVGADRPLSNSNIQHMKKHTFEGMREQARHLTDAQLQAKLNQTFFNRSWSLNEVTRHTQNAFNYLRSQGIVNGTHQIVVGGETINIVIRDGRFITAWGNHQFTVSDFR